MGLFSKKEPEKLPMPKEEMVYSTTLIGRVRYFRGLLNGDDSIDLIDENGNGISIWATYLNRTEIQYLFDVNPDLSGEIISESELRVTITREAHQVKAKGSLLVVLTDTENNKSSWVAIQSNDPAYITISTVENQRLTKDDFNIDFGINRELYSYD